MRRTSRQFIKSLTHFIITYIFIITYVLIITDIL